MIDQLTAYLSDGIRQLEQERDTLRAELEAARGLLRDIYMTCSLPGPSEHAIRDISHQIKLLLTTTPAPESPDHMEDVLAMVEQGDQEVHGNSHGPVEQPEQPQ